MPIPFILGALAVSAGAYGIKKGINAKNNLNQAKKINDNAQELVSDTENLIESAREVTNNSIKELGKMKIKIMSGSLSNFVENFSRLKKVEFSDIVEIEELRGFNPDSQDFLEIKNSSFKAKELATGGLVGIGAGTLLAVGAFKAGTLIGVASTGTAISALSGAAATNATLAWLGGGALSIGGFGMAGGMAVLGGIVAGPALAIGGAFMAFKAEKSLNDAKSNMDQAVKFAQEGNDICKALEKIQSRSTQILNLLERLDKTMKNLVRDVKSIIDYCGTDWRKFNRVAKEKIGMTAQVAKIIKNVIDTPLLTEEGNLNDSETQNVIDYCNENFLFTG